MKEILKIVFEYNLSKIILYIINKIEDNPLSADKKKLIEELKEKYKKNSFILDLIVSEIK